MTAHFFDKTHIYSVAEFETPCVQDEMTWQRWNRVSGSRVTGSAILVGSSRVTDQCVRPGV